MEIYIGNDQDYTKNEKCPGGPYMKYPDDQTGAMVSGVIAYYTWNYGTEAWCNLEGRVVTIEADMAAFSGQAWQVSICSIGIFGTVYMRDTQAPSSISLY